MDRDKLLRELQPYSVKDLELIAATQQDLYSPEEMDVIRSLIAEKKWGIPQVDATRRSAGPGTSRTGGDDGDGSRAFEYVMSFLVPLVGFILGSLLLAKDDPDEKLLGKRCILLGFFSVITIVLIAWIIVNA